MASVWPEQYIAAGDTADPRDVMRNFNTFAREWNGYWDRENVPDNTATVARLAVQALMAVSSSHASGTALTISAASTGVWQTVRSTTVTCTDGLLTATGQCNYQFTTVVPYYNDKVEFRLLINGFSVATAGWATDARYLGAVRLCGCAPVATGSAAIVLQARTYVAPFRDIDDINNGVTPATAYANNPTGSQNTLYCFRPNLLWELCKV